MFQRKTFVCLFRIDSVIVSALNVLDVKHWNWIAILTGLELNMKYWNQIVILT